MIAPANREAEKNTIEMETYCTKWGTQMPASAPTDVTQHKTEYLLNLQ